MVSLGPLKMSIEAMDEDDINCVNSFRLFGREVGPPNRICPVHPSSTSVEAGCRVGRDVC